MIKDSIFMKEGNNSIWVSSQVFVANGQGSLNLERCVGASKWKRHIFQEERKGVSCRTEQIQLQCGT